ncbi:GGDEF domain-containing protein [Streptomyces spiralis]
MKASTHSFNRERRNPLTGLLGHDGYTAHAAALTARHTRDAMVLICDVDKFKQINDTHGHAAGDRALAVTAQRLTAWAGSRGIVGRLGGDEFTLTVRIAPADRRLRLEQLAAALAEPVDIGDGLVDVAVSVGAATPDRVGTTDLSQLQRAADAAMYAGKQTGQRRAAGHHHLGTAA